jgi:hypothetical protein
LHFIHFNFASSLSFLKAAIHKSQMLLSDKFNVDHNFIHPVFSKASAIAIAHSSHMSLLSRSNVVHSFSQPVYSIIFAISIAQSSQM